MMRLTRSAQVPAINQAYSLLPPRIAARVDTVHFCTEDPLFVGLFEWETTEDGRSYHDTACCAWRYMLHGYQQTTIVLPTLQPVWVIVHELGHALQETLKWDPKFKITPVTLYAQTDPWEAFAEAFCRWLDLPEYREMPRCDKRTAILFESLAA